MTMTEETKRTALVVSGGGCRGAFAVGAIEVLRERGYTFDLVSGTSTGGLIAPLVAIDRIDRLHEIYTETRTKDVLRVNLLGFFRKALFDSAPLQRLIEDQIEQLDMLRLLYDTACRVFICTVNLQKGRTEYWSQHAELPQRARSPRAPVVHHITSEEMLASCLVGSSNQPLFMPPIEIDVDGDVDQHLDGGLREIAPLKIVLDHGAERVFSIVLCPHEVEPTEESFSWLAPIGLRTIDLMTQEILQNDLARAEELNELLRYLDETVERARMKLSAAQFREIFGRMRPALLRDKQPVDITVIRPEKHLTDDSLKFDPEKMKAMLQLGREAAVRALDGPRPSEGRQRLSTGPFAPRSS
jgi:NTE family protein